MSIWPTLCPEPPEWRADWQAIDEQFDWIRAMRGCPQDPVFHAEGDVWVHVRMVCDALAGLDDWRGLPQPGRELLFAAALLHDVAKPACTRTEEGRITSRGHSQRGAQQSRRILWESGVSFAVREHLCGLVRYHQTPFHLMHRADAERLVFAISQTVRCDLLALLARADILGRKCADQADLLAQVDLFQEFCREHRCLNAPREFPSMQSRFEYFRTDGRDPNYKVHEEGRFEVILMAGLPGAGKDTWVAHHEADLPRVSLDAVRAEIGADPTGNQGAVVQAAKERAREFLRKKRPFVWNATNLGRDVRTQLVDLFTGYGARVRIVYVEASHHLLFQQNLSRATPVPRAAIEHMLHRWEVPSPVEAPVVEWWVDGKPTFPLLL